MYIYNSRSYLGSLSGLVLLPFGDLGRKLLNHSRDVGLVHRRVDLDLGEVLNDTNVHVELGLRRRGGSRGAISTALLTLLALLSTGANKVFVLVLLQNLHALDARVIDLAANLGAESGGFVLLFAEAKGGEVVGWVEVTDKTLGDQNLISVSRARGLFQLLVGNLPLLLAIESLALSLLLLPADFPSLILVLLVGLAGLVVVVLDLTDGSPLRLLLTMELGALVTQRIQVLENTILLRLDGIEFLLDLRVLVAQSLGLGVVEGLLEGSNLGLEVVDHLLGIVEAGEVLALLAHARNIGEDLLLIHQAEGTRVDLFLQTGNFTVHLLDVLKRHAGAGVVLLRNAGLECRIDAIDLLLGARSRGLESLLLLANGGQLSAELLLSLCGRRVLVVGLGGFDLGLDLVLI